MKLLGLSLHMQSRYTIEGTLPHYHLGSLENVATLEFFVGDVMNCTHKVVGRIKDDKLSLYVLATLSLIV